MKRDSIKFLIAGVGGQGTILAASILAEVGIRFGYDVKKSDILGLAVRGGSVVSHILWAGRSDPPCSGQEKPMCFSASSGWRAFGGSGS